MKKKFSWPQIVAKLRQADILIGQGKKIPEVCKEIDVSENTYYRWQYGGMSPDMIKQHRALQKENTRLRKVIADQALDIAILKESTKGKLISPASKRRAVEHLCRKLGISQRRACKALGQHRSTQRYRSRQLDKDKPLIKDMLKLSLKHPRYGYRRITILLRENNWLINFKRVYRLWCQEGLRVPKKQHKRLYTGTSANSCDRKRPQCYNHVWSYDFLTERLENGTRVRLLVVIDEYTRESLAIDVASNFSGQDVVELLRYLFAVRGHPAHIRSDNGPEFISSAVQKWLKKAGVETLYIAPASPWENGYIESFNSRFRDELLNRELFLSIDELRYVADRWRMDYNHYRPHSSLDYMAPAAFAASCLEQGSGSLRLTQ
ncbi:MAG: IS3 family transposase, partial [Planctomycetota bacterium]